MPAAVSREVKGQEVQFQFEINERGVPQATHIVRFNAGGGAARRAPTRREGQRLRRQGGGGGGGGGPPPLASVVPALRGPAGRGGRPGAGGDWHVHLGGKKSKAARGRAPATTDGVGDGGAGRRSRGGRLAVRVAGECWLAPATSVGDNGA